VHQRNHGEQQRVERQLAHPLVRLNGAKQLLRLRLGPCLGIGSGAHLAHRHCQVPVAQELHDVGVAEIAHGSAGEISAQPRRARITHNPAGDNKAARGVGGGEGFDQPRHPPPQVGIRHLIQSIEQHHGIPCFQVRIEEMRGQLHPVTRQQLPQVFQ